VLDVNLQVSGTARRITGDFSNATVASRVMFQTSTTNGETSLGVIPNGTSPNSGVNIFNAANPTNAAFGGLLVGATEFQIRSAITGSGTYLPMTFYTGGSERVRVDTSGNVGIGTSSPNTRLTIGGYSSVNQTPDIQITRSSSGTTIQTGPNITFGDGTTNNSTAIQVTQGRFGVWNYGAGAWNERMSINSSGNVGIGTTSPSNKFVVSNNGAAGLEITPDGLASNPILVSYNRSTSAYGQLSFASDFLVFCTNGVTEQARITSAGLLQFNSGYGSVATAYGCRAWINFDGTGTPAARASGNVSSITDNGTGDYTINFTNAMPDGNYAPVFGYGQSEAAAAYKFAVRLTTAETGAPTTMTTTALRVISGGTSNLDFANLYVAIFR
jgi:hypothetical protein